MLACLPSSLRADEPYHNLRDTTLGYHGDSEDFTHLTEIRLGWFGPTDVDDPVTGDLWSAADLAVREANEQRTGADPASFAALPFRLVPSWAPDPWRAGVSLLTRMVYDEQPLALLGSVDSSTTHLAEQVVAKAQLPLVSPIATDKTATLAGVSWMFSCAPDDDAIARVLVGAIRDGLTSPADKIVLLATTDHESRMSAREIARELQRRGLKADFRFDVAPGMTDAARQLQATTDAQPAVVIIVAGVEDAARLTKAIHDKIGTAAIFGNQSMSRSRFAILAGPAAEGVRFPLLFVPDPADANLARFIARFTSDHHRAPDYTAVLGYDATRLLLEAIRRAGPNRARVREALIALSPWNGLAGTIRFDGTGQNTRSNVAMGTIRDGAAVPLLFRSNSQPSDTRPATP